MRRLLLLLLLAVSACSRPPGPTLEEAVQQGPRVFPVESRWAGAGEARTHLEANRFSAAEAALRRGAEEHPDDAGVQALLGDLAQRRGNFESAGRHYEEAFRLSDGAIPAFFRLYENYLLSRPAEAVRVARDLVARMPRSPAGHLCLAEGLVFQAVVEGLEGEALERQLAEARQHAERSLALGRLGPLGGDPYATLGEVDFLRGDRAAARENFEKALEQGIPNRERAGDVANALGLLAVLEGDRAAADKAWRRYLEMVEGSREDSSFRMLPKWEIAQYYRSVLAGAAVSPQDLHRLEPVYQELRDKGVVEFEDSKATRSMLFAVDDLRQRGRYTEALELIRPELEVEEAGSDELAGVSCFYYFRIEEPLYSGMLHILAGDLALEAGQREEAARLYRGAEAFLPGCPLVEERIRGADPGGLH